METLDDEKIEKPISYKQEKEHYEGQLTYENEKIKLILKKKMEPLFWQMEFTLADLIKSNKIWQSFIDDKDLLDYMVTAFEKSENMKISVAENTDLEILFNYVRGFKTVKLPLKIKRGKFDVEMTVIEQGRIIKELNEVISGLNEEKKELHATIEKLKEEEKKEKSNFEMVQIGFDSNNAQISTYSSNFSDMAIKSGSLTMKKKGKLKLDLHLNGIYPGNAAGYNVLFRLDFTDNKTNTKKYIPSEKGWLQRCYNNGSYRVDCSMAFCDITELAEGTYTVKLQWAYSSNSSSYYFYYYYDCGDIKLFATIFYD